MTIDSFPLGANGGAVGNGNIRFNNATSEEPNVAVSEQDLRYKTTTWNRFWFTYYETKQCWKNQPQWIKLSCYITPLLILLFCIAVMGVAIHKHKQTTTDVAISFGKLSFPHKRIEKFKFKFCFSRWFPGMFDVGLCSNSWANVGNDESKCRSMR